MPNYEINNLTQVVKDVGSGKQPLGTIYETINLVPTKKRDSLVSRNGYTTGLSAPSGLSVLYKMLTFPLTFPTSQDFFVYFYTIAGGAQHIGIRPYAHNGSSFTDGWVDIADSITKTVDAAFKTATTITGSPTNTYVLANADTTYGLSAVANYYKNWVLVLGSDEYAGSPRSQFLIKSYSVDGSHNATFTLDQIMDVGGFFSSGGIHTFDKTHLTTFQIYRYFHQDRFSITPTPFAPAFTSPAGYFTETALRFSGGGGSTVGYKNMWYGYISRNFFSSAGASAYTFQGTYCDQAEIFSPTSTDTTNSRPSILKSIAQANTFSSEVITDEKNRSFNAASDWVGIGNHIAGRSIYGNYHYLNILTSGAGDNTSNNVSLASTKTNALVNGTSYVVRFKYRKSFDVDTTITVEINGQTLQGTMLAQPIGRGIEFETLDIPFTASGTTAPTIKLWFDTPVVVFISSINVFYNSEVDKTLEKGKTIKYYAVFVYDGFQRSDPKYLGNKFINIASPVINVVLQLRLGDLNKRITAIESYCTIEDGDTSNVTTVRIAPLYFMHNIPICDSDTGWTFNTATGCYEYTDRISGNDFAIVGDTWEQKTRRIENTSITCSYSIAENCSGRIFLAQFYDYVEGRTYTNAIRYTNFDKQNMCPDIFSSTPDEFVTKINAGAGTNITTLFELKGELVVGKEASVLRIPVDQPKTFWVPIVISNSVGVLNDFVMQSLGNTLIWTDDNGIYRWRGGDVELWGDGIWAQFYRDNKTSNQIAWIDEYDGSYNLSLNYLAGNYYKFYSDLPFPYYQNLVHNVSYVVVTKNGSVYFATTGGVNYLFNTGKQDAGTNFTTQLKSGNHTIANNKIIYVKEVQADLEINGTVAGALGISFYADQTLIATATITTTTLKKFRFIPPLIPARTFEIALNYTGTPLTSNDLIVYNRIGIDYDMVDSFGDVKAL